MSYIHIHELPEMRYNQVQDTDMIPIENDNDTWYIPVADLKMLFGNDAKINAIYESLLEIIKKLEHNCTGQMDEINQILSEHTQHIKSIIEDIQKVNGKITKIENRVTTVEGDLKSLSKKVQTIEDQIAEINATIDKHNTRISDLEQKMTVVEQDIANIEKTINRHDEDISQIQSDIKTIYKKIEDMNAVSTDMIEELEKKLTDQIIQKYEELLDIIDECHHQTPIIC